MSRIKMLMGIELRYRNLMSAMAFGAHHVGQGFMGCRTPCVSTNLAWEGSLGVDILHTEVDSDSCVVR